MNGPISKAVGSASGYYSPTRHIPAILKSEEGPGDEGGRERNTIVSRLTHIWKYVCGGPMWRRLGTTKQVIILNQVIKQVGIILLNSKFLFPEVCG